jgi:hypothetical protein
MNFKCYKWDNLGKYSAYKLGIAGFENLSRWFNEIKPANSKHFKRVSIFG